MNVDDLFKMIVDGSPERLINFCEKNKIDLSDIGVNFGQVIAKERYGVSNKDIKAIDFLFWFAYSVESFANELIVDPEVHIGARKILMTEIVAVLSFGQKIKVLQKIYTNKKDPLIKLMRLIQHLRNNMAHGRFNDLQYKNHHLSDKKAQILLMGELRDATRK